MATIINNPGESSDSSGGWAVAVVILLIVIVGGVFAWSRYHRGAVAAPGATVQVNLPTGGSNSGGTGGAAQ